MTCFDKSIERSFFITVVHIIFLNKKFCLLKFQNKNYPNQHRYFFLVLVDYIYPFKAVGRFSYLLNITAVLYSVLSPVSNSFQPYTTCLVNYEIFSFTNELYLRPSLQINKASKDLINSISIKILVVIYVFVFIEKTFVLWKMPVKVPKSSSKWNSLLDFGNLIRFLYW